MSDQLKVVTLVNCEGEIVRRWYHIYEATLARIGASTVPMWRLAGPHTGPSESGPFTGPGSVVAFICPEPGMYIDIKPELGTPEEIVARIAVEEDGEKDRPYAAEMQRPDPDVS